MQRSKKREERIISTRGTFLIFFCVFLFVILFSRLLYLQIMGQEKFIKMRHNNVVKMNYLTPQRGSILDRNNKEVAGNRESFSVIVVPEKIIGFNSDRKKSSEEFIDNISKIISLTEKEKEKIVQKMRMSPMFTEITIKTDISMEELGAVTQNKKYLPAIDITSSKVREYFDGENYIHVLGYVGKVSREDLTSNNKFLTPLDYVGKKGIEKEKDDILLGQHGREVIGTNAHGRSILREKSIDPQKGGDIVLTIDDEIQKLAYKLLGNEKGAIVAMNPNNGEIIAMASTPTYDPNKLIKGISQKEYNEVFNNIDNSPFFNRAISGQYPPASTIKPFVSMAALLGNWIEPDKKLWCGPYYQLPGSSRKFNDWKPQGHGWINMEQSIERSADVYYYRIGKDMGIDYIHDVLSYFSFGKKTEINLEGEKSGLLPSTKWKKENKKESWYTGETLIASIGQGFMLSTPMQLAEATSILVNGGTNYKPKLLLDEEIEIKSKVNLKKEYVDIVKKGMRDVIFGEYGTARKLKYTTVRYDQGGKTGTAQVYSTKGERPDKDVELPKELKDHALYIGFAPFNNPEIVVSVVIENVGGGSTFAAPVGVEIMQAYLDKYHPDQLLEGKKNLREESQK